MCTYRCTFQLDEILGSSDACREPGFSTQNGERTLGCIAKEQHVIVRVLWERGLRAKDMRYGHRLIVMLSALQ
jgi:hypothetical protein